MSENRLSLRVMTLPRDTNQYGTIFGGVILSYIDQAGFVEARRHGVHRWVTASIERVDFKAPVHLGDTVNFLTKTVPQGDQERDGGSQRRGGALRERDAHAGNNGHDDDGERGCGRKPDSVRLAADGSVPRRDVTAGRVAS